MGTKSIQFYYDDQDGDLKDRLQKVAKRRWGELRLSTSQVAKALLMEKLREQEADVGLNDPIPLRKKDEDISS
ncbi:MAG: hypothetical protein ACE5E0_00450 [Terriglobia bacterium]